MNELPAFSLADAGAVVFVALSGLLGLRRGLTKELSGTVIAGLSLTTAALLYHPFLAVLLEYTDVPPRAARVFAFAAGVLVPMAALILVFRLAGRFMTIRLADGLERLGGLLAGAINGAGLVLLAFLCLNILPEPYRPPPFGEASLIGRAVIRSRERVFAGIEERVRGTQEAIRKAREERTGKREKWEE